MKLGRLLKIVNKLFARIYILFWFITGFFGSTIIGVLAGIDTYLKNKEIMPSILIFLICSIFLFFPIGIIAGFALCDKTVFDDAR